MYINTNKWMCIIYCILFILYYIHIYSTCRVLANKLIACPYLTITTPGIHKALKKLFALFLKDFLWFLLLPLLAVVIFRSSDVVLMSGSFVDLINGVVSSSLSSQSSVSICKLKYVYMYVHMTSDITGMHIIVLIILWKKIHISTIIGMLYFNMTTTKNMMTFLCITT